MTIRTLLACALLSAFTTVVQAQAVDVKIPVQTVDAKLRARLPPEILSAGVMTAVNNGSFPPYEIVTGTHSAIGASVDLTKALGEMLGIRIEHATVNGLAAILMGIKGGRYQFAIGPHGDFPDRQAHNDFVDFVQEYVVFAVAKGNPKAINGLDDTCGKRIAVMAAGSAEKVIKRQAEICKEAGKPAVEVQSYQDQPTSTLAVRSGRADAFFSSQAPLTYFVAQSGGALELAGTGRKNGFGDLYQGSITPKGSALTGVLLEAYEKLFDNGTYAAIMKKWGLQGNMLKAPGINLSNMVVGK